MYSGTDNTRRGHIIGAAQVRAPAPERQMTAASTAVVRLLLHMSMYLGATESPQVFVSFDSYKNTSASADVTGYVLITTHTAIVYRGGTVFSSVLCDCHQYNS